MTETCFVTQVRLLAALDVANAATQAKKPPARLNSFFAAFAWPFLPQVDYAMSNECKLAEKKSVTKDAAVVHPLPATSKLRQRKAAAMAVISAALAPLERQLQLKESGSFNLPAVVLLILRGLHSSLAKSLLGAAVVSALLLVIGEMAACLVGVYTAAKLPAGLYFMVAALSMIGIVAAQAILQDTASIQRRKSSLALLNR